MGQQILSPRLCPSLKLLQKGLDDNYANFDTVMMLLAKRGVDSQWKYYKDGKSWLCKVQYKKKTVLCGIGVEQWLCWKKNLPQQNV